MAINNLEGNDLESQKAVPTQEKQTIACNLALRSIGYKSVRAEPGIPFDDRKGVAQNENGKIEQGLYCSGWLSTGPVGVILSTMTNAFSVAQLIHKDIVEKSIDDKDLKPGSLEILKKIHEKGIQIVNFEDWEKIDEEEKARGKSKEKPREKIVSVKEMLKIAA